LQETQGYVGIDASEERPHGIDEKEPQIYAPTTESQILGSFEAQEDEVPTLEEPYVPSTKEPQDEDVQPTSIQEQEETPTVKEAATDPVQGVDDHPNNADVHAPSAVPIEKKVKAQEGKPGFEEVARSLELPTSQHNEETQGDVGVEALPKGQDVSETKGPEIEAPTLEEPYVPSIKEPHDEDVKPTSIEDDEKTPIMKEDMSTPTQIPQELGQHDDVKASFEDPTRMEVEPHEGELGLEELPKSFEFPISHPVEETQGNVRIDGLEKHPHGIDEEQPQIHAATTESQILGSLEAREDEAQTLQEPYVPSTKEPQDDDVQSTFIQEQKTTPTITEAPTDTIQGLDKLPKDADLHAQSEVPTEKKVEVQEAKPGFEEVPRSLELPTSQHDDETQGDVGVEALPEGQDVLETKELEIEPLTLEEPYVSSIQESQDQDVKPTSIKDEEETPIIKEDISTPTAIPHELAQHDDVEPPFQDPTRMEVEPEEVEPSLEELPKSFKLPITHPSEETQGLVAIHASKERPHGIDEEEPQIHTPSTEPQILVSLQGRKDEAATLQEPYVSSTKEPKDEDVQPTSIQEQQETPTLKEASTDPIQGVDELPKDADVHAPSEVTTEKKVEAQEAELGFEEVPRSFELPILHHVDETQGDLALEALLEGQDVFETNEPKIEAPTLQEPYVRSIKEPQDPDVKPISIEDDEATPIIKEDTSMPIQIPQELAQHDDVQPPFEDPTRMEVEPEEAEPSLEELPKSFELPITHPLEETQGNVGMDASEEHPHGIDEEEPQIAPRITQSQILGSLEAREDDAPTLQEPYVPSSKEPQDEDVQSTSIQEQEDTPTVKEATTDPIQGLDKLPKDVDVHAPSELPTEKTLEVQEVESGFEEVPRSLELPTTQHDEEIQGDVGVEALLEVQDLSETNEPEIKPPTLEVPYVPSIEEPHDEDVQPISIEDKEGTPIIKEDMSRPIQIPQELAQHDDVEAPFQDPTRMEVEPEEAEPSLEELPKSFELPITHPLETR
jgi:hypothetical protein